MRGVEHEDITKYKKYHSYQDHIIEERERNVSELKLTLKEKEHEIEILKNEINKMKNHIEYLEHNKFKNKNKILKVLAIIVIYISLLPVSTAIFLFILKISGY